MPRHITSPRRRALLLGAAILLSAGAFAAEEPSRSTTTQETSTVQDVQGKPGDFDFLAGEWKISHRRLKDPKTQEWDEFEGEATVWSVLDGVGSIEELRIPARQFAGMGVRLLDVEKRIWNDHWVNARSGVLGPGGLTGVFRDGVGVFEADDMDGDKPIKVRGVWDRITPTSCRWYQTVSYDGGKTWQDNWYMDWQRVGPARRATP
jgi:hypothetical protein